MSFTITAPSKTFLIGEYVALNGGPTLVVNTLPRFELKLSPQNIPSAVMANGINSESPAGKFLKQNSDDFKPYQLQFLDPHQNAGGFGASSAQFAMVVIAQQLISSIILQNLSSTKDQHLISSNENITASKQDSLCFDDNKFITLNSERLLALYQQCSWTGQGTAPSGVDVIAQCTGRITYFHRAKSTIEQLRWPFKDIDFCLIRTGHKIATHHHLAELSAINIPTLEKIVPQTYQSLINNNSAQFVDSINQYAAALQKQQLVADTTLELLQTFMTLPHIVASKGCGALGADVILVIFETPYRDTLLNSLQQLDIIPVICGHHQISHGVQCSLPVTIQMN